MYADDAVTVTKGEPKVYSSSEHGRRHFCGNCGTGLFYVNANMLPGIIDPERDLRRSRCCPRDGAYPGRRAPPLDGARARAADIRPLSTAAVAARRDTGRASIRRGIAALSNKPRERRDDFQTVA
nr:GFA family protein [Bradyrhizobium niftali]